MQSASGGNSVTVAREPTVSEMKKLIESRQAKDGIERPGPPDSTGYIQVNVGPGDDETFCGQQANVVQ